MTIDMDVTEFPRLEAGFMVMRVVMSKGCIVVTASPPDFSTDDHGFFFFD